MTCPKCGSAHTMSATKKETFMIKWFVAGREDVREGEAKTVTHKCLDCGNEWDGQAKTEGSSPAVGIKFRCMFCGKEFDNVEACNVCEESH